MCDLPPIRQAVTIGVSLRHVRSVLLFFSVGQAVSIPVGSAVRRIERVGTLACDDRSRHQNED
jgi:hypothetical protein